MPWIIVNKNDVKQGWSFTHQTWLDNVFPTCDDEVKKITKLPDDGVWSEVPWNTDDVVEDQQ